MHILPRRHLPRLAALVFFAAVAAAQAGGFSDIILSSSEGAEASEAVFATDTPEIFLSAHITKEVKTGSKVTPAWIAIDTGGVAPPNYSIAVKDYDVGIIDNTLDASLTRPTDGWPVGSYEVRLSVNGELDQAVGFSVRRVRGGAISPLAGENGFSRS